MRFCALWSKGWGPPVIDERRDSDDSGPPLCDEEFTRMREIVSAEYDKWVKALGLEPVPLDVYGYCKTSDVKTQHGTDVTNGTPGYDGHIIVMPLWPKTTREQGIVLPEFPPSSWRESPQIWPEWRTNLLHEVVHQLEDKVLHIWSGEENPRTYLEALKEAAARLSRIKTVALDDLETLTWPQLTNRIKLSSPSISDSKPSNVEHENGKNSKFQS